MKLFSLSVTSLILRFYLLMGIVIGAFFIGYPVLSILSLPVFLSCMMGVKFTPLRLSSRSRKAGQEPAEAYHSHQTAH